MEFKISEVNIHYKWQLRIEPPLTPRSLPTLFFIPYSCALKILSEGEYIMFSITILRGQYEAGKYEGEIFVPGTLRMMLKCLDHPMP